MSRWTEINPAVFRRRDGAVVFPRKTWFGATLPTGEEIKGRENAPKRWKTAAAAMRAVDQTIPYSPPLSRVAALIRKHKAFLRSTLPAWIMGHDQ